MPPKTRIQKLAESLTSKATKDAGRSNATKSYSGIKPEDLDKETPEMLEQRRIGMHPVVENANSRIKVIVFMISSFIESSDG